MKTLAMGVTALMGITTTLISLAHAQEHPRSDDSIVANGVDNKSLGDKKESTGTDKGGFYFKLFPVSREGEGEKFWKKPGLNSLVSASITVDQDVVAGSLELLAFPVGRLRLGVGSTIAAATDSLSESQSSEANAVERLVSGGGSIHATVSLPVVYGFDSCASKFWTSDSATAVFLNVLQFRLGFDTPKAPDTVLRGGAWSATLANETFFYEVNRSNKFGYEVGLRLSWSHFNDTFKAKVNSAGNDLGIVSVRGGVILFGQTRINLVVPLYKTKFADDRVSTRAVIQRTFGI